MVSEPIRPPLYGTDDRGNPVVRVKLAGLEYHALIDVADYETLIARGVSPNWSFDGRFVRAGFRPFNTQRIARLVMDPPKDHHVRHRNGNALDLRRENLFLMQVKRHPKPTLTGQHRPL